MILSRVVTKHRATLYLLPLACLLLLHTYTVNALEGENNKKPEICQALAGAAYSAYTIAGLAPPPLDIPGSIGAYGENLALKLCPPQIVAPQDLIQNNSFEPDDVASFASDSGTSNWWDDPRCYASVPQNLTKQAYENFLGASIFSGNWGALGTPKIYHFNSGVDVRLYQYREDNPETTGKNEALSDHYPLLKSNGNTFIKLPVGKNRLEYRADTLVSILDLIFIYIPVIPSGSKQYVSVVKASKPLTKQVINGFKAIVKGFGDIIVDEGKSFLLDEAIGINFRHSQLGPSGDIYNRDFQQVWVYDLIPPVISTQTDISILPSSVQELISYDASEDLFYIEAIHPGGIRANKGISLLRPLLEYSDHCNRVVTVGRLDDGRGSLWTTGSQFDITWVASDKGPKDASGGVNQATVTQRVIIQDSFPPQIIAAPSQVFELPAGQQSLNVNLGSPRVFDLADLSPDISNDVSNSATFQFGLGLNEVTWTAVDDDGNSSTAVQLIIIKEEGTNTPPVADPQVVETVTFKQTEIILTGSDADFHPSVNRFDPLTFNIESQPSNGDFIAPLLPYFTDDYRLEASALKFANNLKQSDPNAFCRRVNDGLEVDPGYYQLEYPRDPKWISVNDNGETVVHDLGSGGCFNNNFNGEARLAIFDANQDLSAAVDLPAGGIVKDIFWDHNSGNIYIARKGSDTPDTIDMFSSSLVHIASYNIQDTRSGATNDISLENPVSVAVDSRGIMYVAGNNNEVIAYLADVNQLNPSPLPGEQFIGSRLVLGTAWKTSEDLPSKSGGSIQSITTDSENNLYISFSNRIVKMSPATLITDSRPFRIAKGSVIGWMGQCTTNLTNEYACDTENQKSLGFSCTSELCDQPLRGSNPGQFSSLLGIAMNPNDILYVSDAGNNRIQRFSSDGAFGGEAKSTGSGYGFLLGDFGYPQDIEVNSEHFYILNTDVDLLHIFKTSPITPIDDATASVLYRSDNNFIGTDRFNFSVTDGFDSATAEVSIDVVRNFRPPELPENGVDVDITPVAEDSSISFELAATDPDEDDLNNLSIVITSPPMYGVLVIDGLNVIYTPDPNYSGTDQFSYQVFDGLLYSEQVGVVSLTVTPTADAPSVEVPIELSANQGFQLAYQVDAFDPDSNELLKLSIDWGDGTSTEEGHFEDSEGRVVGIEEIFDDSGNLRTDLILTGPMLNLFPNGRGQVLTSHTYATSGSFQISACISDQTILNSQTLEKQTTPLSQEVCEITQVEVLQSAELLIDVQSPALDDPRQIGEQVEFPVTLRNLPFTLEQTDPRFSELPEAGVDISNLSVSGEVAVGLNLLGVTSELGDCSISNNEFSCSFESLAYANEAELTVSTQIALTVPGGSVVSVTLQGNWDEMRQTASGAGSVKIKSSGNPPTLIALSVNKGLANALTPLTLSGTMFEFGSKVFFGTLPGQRVEVVDSSTITVLAPIGPIGSYDVTVINPDKQQSKLLDAWQYVETLPPPSPPPNPIVPNDRSKGGGLGWLALLGLIWLAGLRKRNLLKMMQLPE